MIYLSISEESIELIHTKKSIFGGESIATSAKKAIPAGIIRDGLIVESESLNSEIVQILNSTYPSPTKDREIALVIPDTHVFIYRFTLGEVMDKDLSLAIIEYVRTNYNLEPNEMENYFRPIQTGETAKEILYTAVRKETVSNYLNFIRLLKYNCNYLTSRSFSEYEILKNSKNDSTKTHFFYIDKNTITHSLFDKYGPLELGNRKKISVSYEKEMLSILEKYGMPGISSGEIFLSGSGANEINLTDLSDKSGREIKLLETFILNMLENKKMEFDTGGIPKNVYCHALGLFFQYKNPMSVNFAKDFIGRNDQVSSSFLFEKKEKENPEIAKEEKVNNFEDEGQIKTEINVPISDKKVLLSSPIEEYKKGGLSRILSGKFFVILAGLIGFAILIFLGINLSGMKKFPDLPFIAKPTLTPSPIPSPTITPTPTLDPKLKRSDLKLSVQNGTDKTGFAKEIADGLEKKGYSGIVKSNADRDSYDRTIIKIKESKKNYLTFILTDLKDVVDTNTVEDLSTDDKYDALIILGKK
jgi:hypothetical protein